MEEERLGKWKAFAEWDKGHRKSRDSAFFALIFFCEIYFQECSVLETVRVSGARATYLPSVEENQVKKLTRYVG